MEPISKSITVFLLVTAFMGAVAKVVKDKSRNPKEIIWSFIASGSSAFAAFLLGSAFNATEYMLLTLIWVGAYMGKEFGEILVEATKIFLNKKIK